MTGTALKETLGAIRKAIVGGVTAGVLYLVGVIPSSGGFDDVTTVGWLGLVLAVLGTGGAVYGTTNTPPGPIDVGDVAAAAEASHIAGPDPVPPPTTPYSGPPVPGLRVAGTPIESDERPPYIPPG